MIGTDVAEAARGAGSATVQAQACARVLAASGGNETTAPSVPTAIAPTTAAFVPVVTKRWTQLIRSPPSTTQRRPGKTSAAPNMVPASAPPANPEPTASKLPLRMPWCSWNARVASSNPSPPSIVPVIRRPSLPVTDDGLNHLLGDRSTVAQSRHLTWEDPHSAGAGNVIDEITLTDGTKHYYHALLAPVNSRSEDILLTPKFLLDGASPEAGTFRQALDRLDQMEPLPTASSKGADNAPQLHYSHETFPNDPSRREWRGGGVSGERAWKANRGAVHDAYDAARAFAATVHPPGMRHPAAP